MKVNKFYWRVFLVAWGVIFIVSMSIDPKLATRSGNLSDIPIFYKFFNMPLLIPLSKAVGNIFGSFALMLILYFLLVSSIYSLLIERAYYLYRKWKVKRQEGGSGE